MNNSHIYLQTTGIIRRKKTMRSKFVLSQKMHLDMDGLYETNKKEKCFRDYQTIDIEIRETTTTKKKIYSLHSFSLLFSFEFLNRIFRCSSVSSSIFVEG